MNADTDFLKHIINSNNFISDRALDQLSESDLASLETRLIEWKTTVSGEISWRKYQRQQAEQFAARTVA